MQHLVDQFADPLVVDALIRDINHLHTDFHHFFKTYKLVYDVVGLG